jgi:2-dehydropantoate 2-reductase
MDKIAAEGLTLRHPVLPPQVVFPQTATTPEGLSTAYDFIFITVKAPDTPSVIEVLQATGLPLAQSYLVSWQNGLGNEEKLAAQFGAGHVIAGTITIPISVPDLGVIEVSKDKGGLGLAPMASGQPVQRLADALTEAGLVTQVYGDYRAMKWSKLLLNIVNNASSAILDQPPAQIVAQPELFNLEIEALQEALAVMKALDIPVVKLPGYRVDWLARLLRASWLPRPLQRAILRPFMLSGRGAKMPSLQIDLEAGRPTSEIEVLNGAIVQAGQQAGLATPVNDTLTCTLSRLVSHELNWQDYRNQPDRLLQAVESARHLASNP